jgi:tetratricopeptide (TPR) repeat protein
MEYSGRAARPMRKRKSTKKWIVMMLIAMLALGFLTAGLLYRADDLSGTLQRIRNAVAFIALGQQPQFYEFLLEKNGKDYRLTSSDVFEVSYRDEFVIKKIVTDVLFAGGVTVDIDALGGTNLLGKLIKGIDLVDKAVLTGRNGQRGNRPNDYAFRIKYQGIPIASVPIRMQITPQDWLRYARSSANPKVQIEYLKRAIALNREDTNVRRMLASLYFNTGMNREAIGQYQEILARKPNDTATLAELAKCYLKLGQYDEVVRISARLAKANPRDDEAHANMALAWSRMGNWDKAIAACQDALKIRPDNPVVSFMLGEAYEKTKQYGKAVEQYRLVLEKVPKADHVAAALADLLLKMGNHDEAVRWYREVVKRQPKNAAAYANLGLAYAGKGLIKEEIENYRKAIELKPDDPVVHFNLGAAYEKGKREPEAVREYQKVLDLRPDDPDALERLADLHFKAKRYGEAAPLYERGVKTSPRKAAIYSRLGYAYAELKKLPQSVESYQKAIKLGAKDPHMQQSLAHAYSQMGKTRESIAMYEQHAAAKPTTETLNILADAYMKEKLYDKAIQAYKKLIELNPKKAAYYSSAAYAYGLTGDLDRQIEYYRLSLRYDPEDDEVCVNLGAAYEKKGLLQDALKAYTTAYELNPDAATAARKIPQIKIKIIRQKQKE